MVSLEVVAILLSGISISASLFYYANVLQNSNKTQQQALETRQAGLFMSLYETNRSIEFRNQWRDVMTLEWKDWNDFQSKYLMTQPPHPAIPILLSVLSFYDGIGVLVKRKLIDIKYVDDLFNPHLLWTWEKNAPIVKGFRKVPTPWEHQLLIGKEETGEEIYSRLYDNFEFLYTELIKYLEENPET